MGPIKDIFVEALLGVNRPKTLPSTTCHIHIQTKKVNPEVIADIYIILFLILRLFKTLGFRTLIF